MNTHEESNSIPVTHYLFANSLAIVTSLFVLIPAFVISMIIIEDSIVTTVFAALIALIVSYATSWVVSFAFHKSDKNLEGKKIIFYIVPITYTIAVVAFFLMTLSF